jgi:hypothetical protein
MLSGGLTAVYVHGDAEVRLRVQMFDTTAEARDTVETVQADQEAHESSGFTTRSHATMPTRGYALLKSDEGAEFAWYYERYYFEAQAIYNDDFDAFMAAYPY